jgi:hypothetical protein
MDFLQETDQGPKDEKVELTNKNALELNSGIDLFDVSYPLVSSEDSRIYRIKSKNSI